MKVKNINGTALNKCKCGSWLQHWRNYSGQTATICRALGCGNKDLVGAHVQKLVNNNNKWYIVPFCKEHNKSNEIIELNIGTVLVSANIKNTCGN